MLVLWVGCTNPNLAGGKLHFDQASKLQGEERTARFERARQTFAQAVQEMPKSGEARLWLGRAYAELDNPDSAGVNFDLAEKLTPEMAKDVQDTRDHYWSVKYNSGLTSAGDATKAKSEGKEALATEDFRDALKQFKKAALYNPSHHETFTMMGKVYLNLAVLDSAIIMLKKAQAMVPDDPKMKDDLFLVYRSNGDKAFAKGGEYLVAGDSTAAKSQFQAAVEFYREADKVSPGESDLNFQMGATAYELSNLIPEKKQQYLGEAVTRYEEVLKKNPADVDVLYNLALTLRDLERYEEAEKIALRLVDVNPREHVYREILGRLQDKLGNKQGLVTGLIFGKALKDGTPFDPSQASARAEKFGTGNDLRRRYLENGAPDEILTFTDSQGQEYDVWFYWTRGVGYGFVQGKEKYTSSFAPSGVLKAENCELTTAGSSKVVTGTLTNSSSRRFDYARVDIALLDDVGAEIGRVHAETDRLDARGTWKFEIPLTGDNEQALAVQVLGVTGF